MRYLFIAYDAQNKCLVKKRYSTEEAALARLDNLYADHPTATRGGVFDVVEGDVVDYVDYEQDSVAV